MGCSLTNRCFLGHPLATVYSTELFPAKPFEDNHQLVVSCQLLYRLSHQVVDFHTFCGTCVSCPLSAERCHSQFNNLLWALEKENMTKTNIMGVRVRVRGCVLEIFERKKEVLHHKLRLHKRWRRKCVLRHLKWAHALKSEGPLARPTITNTWEPKYHIKQQIRRTQSLFLFMRSEKT